MSISTGRGDDGSTRLIDGLQVSKSHPRVEAYGTVDELGSCLGVARAHCVDDPLAARIEQIQRDLFIVCGELACSPSKRELLRQRLGAELVTGLQAQIDEIEALPGILDDWALPGATELGGFLDVARTVCRRAERNVVRLFEAGEKENELVLVYLNRLGDLLWLYARWYELRAGAEGALRPRKRT
ncbi:MAG: cob(I)yrinic acid a,c-diamide adenosyltransferase [Armatimonadetes bacterium]|nr:cob(I)yrinic acid a,c-diamide adenosyltransferase [Armatimonadota bacterium]